MTHRLVRLTDVDSRRLRTVLDDVGDQTTAAGERLQVVANSQQVIVEFIENVDPGDHTPKQCVLFAFDGAEFVDTLQLVPVRLLSPAGVAASKSHPVRCVARATGNLGLCAETAPRRQAFLTTDMLAAVDTRRDPSTATALLLNRRSNGDFSISTHSVEIVNRFEDISADAGTYVKIEWMDGEIQPYAANCPSIASDSGSF